MSFVHGIFGAYRQDVTKGRLAARYASLARLSDRIATLSHRTIHRHCGLWLQTM